MEMKCTVDLKLRKLIELQGLVYELRVVQIADVTKRSTYQTRVSGGGTVDQALVAEYVVAMKEGNVFPELLLALERDGKLSVVCGAHRLVALRSAGITAFQALVITVGIANEAWQLRMISAADNNTHGWRQSNSAQVEIAAKEIFNLALPPGSAEQSYATIKVVSERYQRPAQSVKKCYYGMLSTAACDKAGLVVKHPRTMAGTLEKLWANYGNTADFANIAKAAIQAGPRGCVEKILDDAKKNKTAPSEVPGLIMDAQPEKVVGVPDPVKVVMMAVAALARAMGKLDGYIVENATAEEIDLALSSCQMVYTRWRRGR